MQSRFRVGNIVWFQPNIEKINLDTGETIDTSSATLAKILKITTIGDRVFYDIAVSAQGGFYEIFPIKAVDSIFICPTISGAEVRTTQTSAKESAYDDYKKIPLPKTSPFDPNPLQPTWVVDPTVTGFPPGTIICFHETPLMNSIKNDDKH